MKAHDPIALERARELTLDLGIVFCDTVLETVEDADAVVLVTEWPGYRDLPWDDICKHMHTTLVSCQASFDG